MLKYWRKDIMTGKNRYFQGIKCLFFFHPHKLSSLLWTLNMMTWEPRGSLAVSVAAVLIFSFWVCPCKATVSLLVTPSSLFLEGLSLGEQLGDTKSLRVAGWSLWKAGLVIEKNENDSFTKSRKAFWLCCPVLSGFNTFILNESRNFGGNVIITSVLTLKVSTHLECISCLVIVCVPSLSKSPHFWLK